MAPSPYAYRQLAAMCMDHLCHIAMLSVHTCPLATLGGKETGGMNVYVRELARGLGRQARAWSEGFSWQIIAAETLAAYDLASGDYTILQAGQTAQEYTERICP